MAAHNDDNTDRFVAYLDGEMDEAERGAFEAELAADAALAAELEQYQKTLGLLGRLESPGRPEHMTDAVEGRIRRRSHGRFFALEPKTRLPYEALSIMILLVATMAIFWSVRPSEEEPGELVPDLMDELASFGSLEMVDELIQVTIPAARLPAFENLLKQRAELVVVDVSSNDDGTERTFILRRGP